MDEEKTDDIGAENAGSKALMVLTPSQESKKLMVLTSREFGVTQAKAQKLIEKYGEETMDAVLEIRDKKECPVSLPYFKKMVDSGFEPEQVQTLYKTRSRFNLVEGDSEHVRMQLTIVQLGHLAHRFADFREAEEDIQFEMIERLVNALGKSNSLGNIVLSVIDRANQYGIDSLDQLIEISFRDDFDDE